MTHRRVRAAGAVLGVVLAAAAAGVAACGGDDPAKRAKTAGAEQAAAPAEGHRTTHSAPPAAPLRPGERFQFLSMASPYTPEPPNGSTDEYRCFLVDPHFATTSYIVGSEFLPENADVVHHAILFRVAPGDVAEARKLDDQTPGDGWTCFGDAGIKRRDLNSSAWIGAWAPGGAERLSDRKIGYEMEPGSQIIMQVHYNLLATGGKATSSDKSGVRLRVVDGPADIKPLKTTLLVAPVELPCLPGETGDLCDRERSVLDVWKRFGREAGATVSGLNLICNGGGTPKAGNTQQCDHRVRQAGVIHAVGGHMHLLGRSIRVELNPGTPQAQVLLDNPNYDFDDQSARPMAAPVAVKPGDTYRVTCTHDASLRTQLPQLKPLKPRYVVWGEGTSDEMCLGIVVWSQP
jgi:hypothetical protein